MFNESNSFSDDMDLGTERARLAQWSASAAVSKMGRALFPADRPDHGLSHLVKKTDSRWCDGEAALRPLWVQARPARQHAQAGERFRKSKVAEKDCSSRRTVVVWGWGDKNPNHFVRKDRTGKSRHQ
jgi:hypothetical protein